MEEFQIIVNSFTDEEGLRIFATMWGLQDTPEVRFRIFQIRNRQYDDEFVHEELETILKLFDENSYPDEDMELTLENTKTQKEIEGDNKTLLTNADKEELTQVCIKNSDCDTSTNTTDELFEPWSPSFQAALLRDENIASISYACIQDGEFRCVFF
jgi:hypothetical protein